MLCGAGFTIQASDRMHYFSILQDKLHLFNIQDHRSTRGLLAKSFKKFPKSPIRPAGVCSLLELRFNIIKNLLSLSFLFNGFITMYPENDVHQRQTTNGTAIKIARETTNNQ